MVVCEKKVVDEVSGWLTIFDDGSVDRTWRGPPEVKFMAEPVPAHEDFRDGVATRDVLADPLSGLKVRIYLPENKPDGAKMPVVVHFHGGGFCISQADWYMYYSTYATLAASAGVIVVSVYLRLAPEHRLPAACEDGYAAVLWLRSVARGESQEEWLSRHADFGRVFLIGDSSGGNIVHQVAARAGEAEAEGELRPVKVAGAIPIHPGFVRVERSRSERENPETPFLTLAMVDKFLGYALPEGSNKEHPITCPMGGEALEGVRMPPVLLCVAEKDLILDTEMEYYEAMKRSGKEIELVESRGMGHSFYLNEIALKLDPLTAHQTRNLFSAITHFIHKHHSIPFPLSSLP